MTDFFCFDSYFGRNINRISQGVSLPSNIAMLSLKKLAAANLIVEYGDDLSEFLDSLPEERKLPQSLDEYVCDLACEWSNDGTILAKGSQKASETIDFVISIWEGHELDNCFPLMDIFEEGSTDASYGQCRPKIYHHLIDGYCRLYGRMFRMSRVFWDWWQFPKTAETLLDFTKKHIRRIEESEISEFTHGKFFGEWEDWEKAQVETKEPYERELHKIEALQYWYTPEQASAKAMAFMLEVVQEYEKEIG